VLDLRINAVVQAFRRRFVQEYAPVITRRLKGQTNEGKLLNENDVVIYCDPTKNPSEWQRGIVCRVYAGRDRRVRVADVQLKSGEILSRRSCYRLAKLDFRWENSECE
jgi:Family of unknown function (DUF5641)